MTETVSLSRRAVRTLPKLQRAVILLLQEEGKIQIVDDESGEVEG